MAAKMNNAKAFRALVVGGGNAGLALAQGLRKVIFYPCYVIRIQAHYTRPTSRAQSSRDSADDFHNKTRDWGMLLHWGGKYSNQVLVPDMQARINEPRVDNFYDCAHGQSTVNTNGKTGEVILRVKSDDLLVRVSRSKLRKFLSEGLDIKCGKKLKVIREEEDGMRAIFEDGTEESGSFVLGTDGPRSKVRQFLVGEEKTKPENLPYTMVNFPAGNYTAEQVKLLTTVHPIVNLANHPEHRGIALIAVLDNPDPMKPELMKFQVFHSWKGSPYKEELSDPAVRMKYVKERVRLHFAEPFRTATLAIDDDVVLPIDRGPQWKPIPWDNRGGKVTLAGDAAHCMLPNRGQGLNNAMQDAAEIVDALKAHVFDGVPLGEAITAYEDEMRPRAVKSVDTSLDTAEKSHDWATIKESDIFKFGHNRETTSKQ